MGRSSPSRWGWSSSRSPRASPATTPSPTRLGWVLVVLGVPAARRSCRSATPCSGWRRSPARCPSVCGSPASRPRCTTPTPRWPGRSTCPQLGFSAAALPRARRTGRGRGRPRAGALAGDHPPALVVAAVLPVLRLRGRTSSARGAVVPRRRRRSLLLLIWLLFAYAARPWAQRGAVPEPAPVDDRR